MTVDIIKKSHIQSARHLLWLSQRFNVIIYWSFLLFGDRLSLALHVALEIPAMKIFTDTFRKNRTSITIFINVSAGAHHGWCTRHHARCPWRCITLLFIITCNNLRCNHTFPSVGSNTLDHNCCIALGYMLVNVGYYSAIANWAVTGWHMHKLSVSSMENYRCLNKVNGCSKMSNPKYDWQLAIWVVHSEYGNSSCCDGHGQGKWVKYRL